MLNQEKYLSENNLILSTDSINIENSAYVSEEIFFSKTRMLFSRKRTICIIHKNILNRWALFSFEILLDYKHIVELHEIIYNFSFDLELNPMTLVLNLDLDIVKIYVY